jgi:hypothetical protein
VLTHLAAGLVTHVLLTLGAVLFTLVSASGFDSGADPTASRWRDPAPGPERTRPDHGGQHLGDHGPRGRRRGRHLRPGRRGDRADPAHRFAISKEEFAIGAGPEFDLSALHELARAEGATLRQLDFEHEAGSDRLLMIVTLPARYPPATFMRLVGELPGVRGVEWDGQLLDAVRVAVATVHPSCSAAPRRPGEGPAVRRGDWSAGCQEAGLRAGSFSPSTFATRLQASWRSPSAQDSSVGSE